MNTLTVFDTSIFEVVDGKVNLTKICKHFGKSINDWTKTKQTQAFLQAFAKNKPDTNIIVSVKGGNDEQGSWTQYREVALKLAQWINPDFEVFCMEKLDELFQKGKVELKPKSTLEMLKMAVVELEAKEKENLLLAKENTVLASRDIEVKTQKEYKWINQEIQNDRGRTINYYVSKHFFDGDYRKAHQKAKEAYRQATGCSLPDNAKNMSIDQKKDYLLFLSKI